MTKETLCAILETVPGCKRTKDDFILAGDHEVTVFAGHNAEGLTVSRIARVEVRSGFVAVETFKGEHVCLAPEDVVAVRWQAAGTEKRPAGMR